MKYGYRFLDWGLYEIDELEEVKELTEDYYTYDCFGKHTFNKEEWVWAKAVEDIFLIPRLVDKHFEFDKVNVGPYFKKDIFDTREEAEAYAIEHSACILY